MPDYEGADMFTVVNTVGRNYKWIKSTTCHSLVNKKNSLNRDVNDCDDDIRRADAETHTHTHPRVDL